MTITPQLEQQARAVGAFLALLALAYPRELWRGGLLLVTHTWLGEALYHIHRYVRSVQPPSEDWISTRVLATRRAAARYWRSRFARRARMKAYVLTWLSKPEFQAEQKKHASRRIAAVARRGH